MIRTLFLILFVFVCSCDLPTASVTLLLDDGCIGSGLSSEVVISGNIKLIFDLNMPGIRHEFYWDGVEGEWIEVQDMNGKKYRTFLLRFCPAVDLTGRPTIIGIYQEEAAADNEK